MVLLLYGEDTFRSKQKLKKMKQKFSDERDKEGLNLVKLDAENSEPGEIEEQIFASPFLSEKRMVIVENFIESDHDNLKERLLEKIESRKIPDFINLIFWEGDIDPNKGIAQDLFDRLQQEKYSQEFNKFEGQKLRAWVSNKIEDLGGDINRGALDYMVRHVGNDMWQLNNICHQLVAYTDKGTIEREDVDVFIKEDVDTDIFNLIDSIVEKKPKEVYNMIREQYRSGKDPHYIFAMVLRQFRIMYKINDAIERGENPKGKKYANKLDLHPYVLKKTRPVAEKYEKNKIEDIYDKLLDIDEKTKTGQHNERLLVDVFVGEICKNA